MLQTKLLTKEKARLYKQVSTSINNDIFNAILLETQIQDIAPLLGEDLFNALMLTPNDYTDLLEGGAYTVGGITYQNYGLEAVITYYWYARYQYFGDVVDTPYSVVNKLNNDGSSQPISIKAKEALYNLNRDTAFTTWKSVENYLIRTGDPLFNNINLYKTEQKRSLKFTKIV